MKKAVRLLGAPALVMAVAFFTPTISGCSEKSTLHVMSPGAHIVHDDHKAKIALLVAGKKPVIVDAEFENVQPTQTGAFLQGDVVTLKTQKCGQYKWIKLANQLHCIDCDFPKDAPCQLDTVDMNSSEWDEIPVSNLEHINIEL